MATRQRYGLVWMMVAMLGATQSCVGGDGDGGGTYSTGLPPDKTLAELSQEEATQACEEFADTMTTVMTPDDVARMTCTTTALAANVTVDESGEPTLDVAACNASVDECMNAATSEPAEQDFVDADIECGAEDVSSSLAGCEATVGDFEGCINAVTRSMRRWLDRLTCDALGEPGALQEMSQTDGTDVSEVLDVRECEALRTQCPSIELFDEEEEPDYDYEPDDSSGETASCAETCPFSGDDECDDGGTGSVTNACARGTDCTDCGPR